MTDLSDHRSVAQHAPGQASAVSDADLARLLEQSATGDEQAFAAVYDATSRLCFGLAVRIVHDASIAEQVTRDAYLHLWSHSVRYDPAEGSAIAWITGLLHRRAVDRARLDDPGRDGTGPLEHRAGDPGPEAGPRECLELAYFGGRTCGEVARVEQIASTAAAQQIRDGLLAV